MTCYEDYNVVSHQRSISPKAKGFSSKGFLAAKQIAKNVIAGFKTRRQQKTDRQAFEQLHLLEDHILDDMGVTRGDLDWARKLPLSVNAGAELHRIQQQARQTSLSRARARPARRN